MNLGGVIHLNKTGICVVSGCVLILFFYMFTKNDYHSTGKKDVNLKELLRISIAAAESGGVQVVSTDSIKIETKGKTKEGANESVTSADFNSHCAMIGTIKHSFPNLKVISEEKTNCQNFVVQEAGSINLESIDTLKDKFVNSWDITVWIDPLDATQEFTEKLTKYVTTMVCVAVNGEPIIGIIHKPFSKETYWGWVNNGQSSNLINKTPEREAKTKFIISRSHSGKINELIEKKFKDIAIIEAGGAGYKVLELISGNADAYLHNTAIKKWDICAGNAILNTLGGGMTTLSGTNISYSFDENVENTHGLIATLKNHDVYLKNL